MFLVSQWYVHWKNKVLKSSVSYYPYCTLNRDYNILKNDNKHTQRQLIDKFCFNKQIILRNQLHQTTRAYQPKVELI